MKTPDTVYTDDVEEHSAPKRDTDVKRRVATSVTTDRLNAEIYDSIKSKMDARNAVTGVKPRMSLASTLCIAKEDGMTPLVLMRQTGCSRYFAYRILGREIPVITCA